ncbi:hypothetical protein BpHYR1_048927 [Brachionus plicatilis]|uniref:Uncharacterized protein n=1 Tax=Brachionus plicatilis TaxID=10195 RepID=A0A3M7PV78_BRAPC|nr:hypothetical protein BpHYR1_048927 [Brachionus plicatilis]
MQKSDKTRNRMRKSGGRPSSTISIIYHNSIQFFQIIGRIIIVRSQQFQFSQSLFNQPPKRLREIGKNINNENLKDNI